MKWIDFFFAFVFLYCSIAEWAGWGSPTNWFTVGVLWLTLSIRCFLDFLIACLKES